ncbi:hypothetical protein V490_06091 [Pseudogymnoascus sp. VKM F-3557]|nr:hypothetical protein V490_06091 [Pseudogymnoascus sp. VKM F-3557]
MAISNDTLEQSDQPSLVKQQQTSLPSSAQEAKAGPSKQWELPPLPQECLLDLQQWELPSLPHKSLLDPQQWELPSLPQECSLDPQDQKNQTSKRLLEEPVLPPSKRSNGPAFETIPVQAKIASDLPRKRSKIPITGAPYSSPYADTSSQDKLTARLISEAASAAVPQPVEKSDAASTEEKTWHEKIPGKKHVHPPEVQQSKPPKSSPRRGKPQGKGKPRPPRPSRAKPKKAPAPMPPPQPQPQPFPPPVQYRRIEDPQGKPIYRDPNHDSQGIAGMIGVTLEEYHMGMRTPVYTPPSDWVRLLEIRKEAEWTKEAVDDLKRREEEMELTRRVNADMAHLGAEKWLEKCRREEATRMPNPEVPALMAGEGGVSGGVGTAPMGQIAQDGAVLRGPKEKGKGKGKGKGKEKGRAESPLATNSRFVGGDEFDNSRSSALDQDETTNQNP